MAMLSIPSYKNDDPNYRYKMPRLVAKVEGRGNGIRTNIVNMGDIARALKRPPDYPTKFCGHELGSQSKFDPSEGKAIVNGSHTQQDLQLLIDKFIDKFVLCEQCKLPEIDLFLKKNRVGYRCNACGNQGLVDNQHKLATFILKNPPDGADSTLGTKNKKNKQGIKKEKTVKSKTKGTDEEGEAIASIADDSKKSKKHKKKKKTSEFKECTPCVDSGTDNSESKETINEAKNKKISKGQSAGVDEESVSDDAGASCRHKPSSNRIKKKKSSIDEENEIHYDSPELKEIIERLCLFLKSSSSNESPSTDTTGTPSETSCTPPLADPSDFLGELRLLQVTQNFNHRVKLFIALNVFFSGTPEFALSKKLDTYLPYLKHVTQGIPQRDILTVFEDYVAMNSTTSLDLAFYDFPYTLQKLYNADILDEEGIIKYYTRSKAKESREAYTYAKKATEPLIKWLRDESCATDSDEESEPRISSLTDNTESIMDPIAQQNVPLVPAKLADKV